MIEVSMLFGRRPENVRCGRCSWTWRLDGPFEEARCPDCDGWNVVDAPSSPWPMRILLVTFAAVCYLLIRPETLARLLGS
jgi:hypothetical protein